MSLKLLALQTLTRNLKQFRNSQINYNACTHFASLWGRECYEHACLVFTLDFESRALLNILRCRFAFHFGGLFMQDHFFVKISEESVIDCGDRLQGEIILRKTI